MKPFIFEEKEVKKALGKNEADLRDDQEHLKRAKAEVLAVEKMISQKEQFKCALIDIMQQRPIVNTDEEEGWYFIDEYETANGQLQPFRKIFNHNIKKFGAVASELCASCSMQSPIVGHTGNQVTTLYVLCTKCQYLTPLIEQRTHD